MTLLTSTGSAILRPELVGPLIVRPVLAASIAAQVSTVVTTSSHDYRLPLVLTDPSAAWVAEGAEIPASDMALGEVNVTPSKLAGLSIISTELAEDTSPAAAEAVGQGLARDIARKLDAAYFGTTVANGPAGLGSLVGVATVDTGAAIASLDPFAKALAAAELVGAVITAWVANPADALALSLIRKAEGSAEPLLSVDGPTAATSRTVLGVPMHVSPAVAPGVVWGIPKDRCVLVVRSDTSVEVSRESFFTSDRVAVRAVMRVGFGFAHPAAVVKLSDVA